MTEIRFYQARGKYGFLSNLYPCKVMMAEEPWGLADFESSEAAYQFVKCRSRKVGQWLVSAPENSLIAMTAHKALLPRHVVPQWNKKKVGYMRAVVLAKFEQHADLREKLLATGDATIIEASKTDGFWGSGPERADPPGKNMLGVILMETREKLRTQ